MLKPILLAGCLLLGLTACAANNERLENIAFPRGLTKPVSLPGPHDDPNLSGMFLIRPEQTIADWTELAGEVTTRPSGNLDQAMQFTPFGSGELRNCPASSKVATLMPVSPGRDMYKMVVQGCPEVPDFVQIGLIIDGTASRWHVFYVARSASVPSEREAEVMRDLTAVRYSK